MLQCAAVQIDQNVGLCAGAHDQKPICGKLWDAAQKVWQALGAVCPDASAPECSLDAAASPACQHVQCLFDDMVQSEGASGSSETVWAVNKWKAEVESDFVTVSFSSADPTQQVAFIEVMRIDVQERSEVFSGEADSIGELEISFSDGKTQRLLLAGHVKVATKEEAAVLPPPARGSSERQVFYIEPAVTHSLTIRVPRLTFEEQLRNPQRNLGLRSLRVWGQALSGMRQGALIPLDAVGYTSGGL